MELSAGIFLQRTYCMKFLQSFHPQENSAEILAENVSYLYN